MNAPLTARQQALFAYLQTIQPALDGAKTPEERLSRVLQCVGEDIGFVANGFLNVAFHQLASAATTAVASTFKNLLQGSASRRKR